MAHPLLSKCQLILQSAWNDVISHPILPNWPLTEKDLAFFENEDVRRRITIVSNPSTFVIGGLVFAATSTDVLYQMMRDECTSLKPATPGGGPKVDKIVRVAQHLLEQRSFFPMFPAPASEAEAAVPLEMNQLWHLGLPVQPDVLLVPSKLKTFAKARGSCLVVNPGNLTRGNTGGTFARFFIFPPSAEGLRTVSGAVSLDDATPVEYAFSDAAERTKVEIVRL